MDFANSSIARSMENYEEDSPPWQLRWRNPSPATEGFADHESSFINNVTEDPDQLTVLIPQDEGSAVSNKSLESHQLQLNQNAMLLTHERSVGFVTTSAKLVRWLQLVGFFPATFACAERPVSATTMVGGCVTFGFITFIAIVVNLSLVVMQMMIFQALSNEFGSLHPESVATFLFSLKAAQNLLNLLVFTMRFRIHKKLLLSLDLVENKYGHCMDSQPNYKTACTIAAVFATFATLLPLGIYLTDLHNTQGLQNVAQIDPFSQLSIILVPLLNCWHWLPFIYFCYITYVLRHWFCALKLAVAREIDAPDRNLNRFFAPFTHLCRCLRIADRLFTLSTSFSLSLAVVALCLVVHFSIGGTYTLEILYGSDSFGEMTSVNETVASLPPDAVAMVSPFLLIWAFIHTLIMLVHVIGITVVGFTLNEEPRQLMELLLEAEVTTAFENFTLLKFRAQLDTQRNWGLSLWRAILIERSLLLSIFGFISSYAVLLTKLSDRQQRQHIQRP